VAYARTLLESWVEGGGAACSPHDKTTENYGDKVSIASHALLWCCTKRPVKLPAARVSCLDQLTDGAVTVWRNCNKVFSKTYCSEVAPSNAKIPTYLNPRLPLG
jgi:hypothetical protein